MSRAKNFQKQAKTRKKNRISFKSTRKEIEIQDEAQKEIIRNLIEFAKTEEGQMQIKKIGETSVEEYISDLKTQLEAL